MTTPTAVPRAGRSCHRVEFYETDATLVVSVVDFLRPALAGGTVIVVATDEHRHAIGVGLMPVSDTVAVPDARVNIIAIDAQQLLDRFMVDGVPDPASFRRELDAMLDGVPATDGPVLIYGEMVAVLWEQGNVAAAIALEDLWNELATSHSFSLLCGYPSAFFPADQAAEFHSVCTRHTEVTGTPPREPEPPELLSLFLDDEEIVECWQLPNASTSGAVARAQLRALLRNWRLADLVDDASLLITELVTNSVLHASSVVQVTVRRRSETVRVEVSDSGAGVLRRPAPSLAATHGRGLLLVECVSAEWGATFDGNTKTVWFELRSGRTG